MRLKTKVALVTGAGGGLGTAIAKRFAGEGAAVLCTDRDLGGKPLLDRERRHGDGRASQQVERIEEPRDTMK